MHNAFVSLRGSIMRHSPKKMGNFYSFKEVQNLVHVVYMFIVVYPNHQTSNQHTPKTAIQHTTAHHNTQATTKTKHTPTQQQHSRHTAGAQQEHSKKNIYVYVFYLSIR